MEGDFFLTNWFLEAMKWVYVNIAGNSVVLTIILCTLLLRLLTMFSDISSRKSSQKMAMLQPQIQKLQAKYANDPQALQREQSKLMKKEGVSMWGGCLPLLITMPLFFCFFAAFRYWASEQMLELISAAHSDMLNGTSVAMDMFNSQKFLWVINIWQPDSALAPIIQDAATFLNTADMERLLYFTQNPELFPMLEEMGMAIQSFQMVDGVEVATWNIIASNAGIANYNTLMAPLTAGYEGWTNGWFLFPIISAALIFVSTKITQRATSAKASGGPKSDTQRSQESTNKMMMYMMPIISFIACLSNNTAFAVYWSMSSIIAIGINLVLNRVLPRNAVPQADGQIAYNGKKR
ncbi:MAG: membrane protein insertase YidC [Clostridia bacterium]|nr:membrane protein insertase YidC [Clostridia bacterium]